MRHVIASGQGNAYEWARAWAWRGVLALRMDLNLGCRAKALVPSVERKRPKGRARVQSQRLERLERLGRAWKQNSEAKKSFEGRSSDFAAYR